MLLKIISKIWKMLPRDGRIFLARLTQQKFTVSVAAVISNEKGEVLVLDHVLRPASGWGLPGGFMQHFEQPDEAIRRELLEETGLELTDVEIYRIRTLKRHVEIIFTARSNGTGNVLSREITDIKWFAPDGLPPEMNIAQQFLIRKVFRLDD